MSPSGWHQLLPAAHCFRGTGRFPIDAYSEFMPPPRFGWNPYAPEPPDPQLFSDEDPWGWYVSEYEEANAFQPGLEQIARQVVGRVWHLLRGHSSHAVSKRFLENNVYWPEELIQRAGSLNHDQGVVLMPLALSRTLDDKGRVRWTLFGASEQGPAKAFWKSFHTAPHVPAPADQGPNFLCHLLRTVYKETVDTAEDLLKAGFRIMPQGKPPLDFWKEEPLPDWATPLKLDENAPSENIKYLLTFRPFRTIARADPASVFWMANSTCCPRRPAWCFGERRASCASTRNCPSACKRRLWVQLVARHRALPPHGLRARKRDFFIATMAIRARLPRIRNW